MSAALPVSFSADAGDGTDLWELSACGTSGGCDTGSLGSPNSLDPHPTTHPLSVARRLQPCGLCAGGHFCWPRHIPVAVLTVVRRLLLWRAVVVCTCLCVRARGGGGSLGALCPDNPAYLSSQQSDGSCGDAFTDLIAMTSIPDPPGGVVFVFAGTKAAAIGTASVAVMCDPAAPRFIVAASAGPPERSGYGGDSRLQMNFTSRCACEGGCPADRDFWARGPGQQSTKPGAAVDYPEGYPGRTPDKVGASWMHCRSIAACWHGVGLLLWRSVERNTCRQPILCSGPLCSPGVPGPLCARSRVVRSLLPV